MYGNRIRLLRKENNMTQMELCNAIGIKRSVLTKYELEQVEPGLEVINKLCDFWGVSIDYLVGRSNIRYSKFSSEKEIIKDFLNELEKIPIKPDKDGLYVLLRNFEISLSRYQDYTEQCELLFESLNNLIIYSNSLIDYKKEDGMFGPEILSAYQETIKDIVDYLNKVIDALFDKKIGAKNNSSR